VFLRIREKIDKSSSEERKGFFILGSFLIQEEALLSEV